LPTTSFTGATVETSIADSDLVLIYDDSATAVRKMTKANLISGIGGTNTPVFYGELASNATISRAVITKITGMTTNEVDSNSAFDGTTFTVPSGQGGTYLIIGSVTGDYADIGQDGEGTRGFIYKNGSSVKIANWVNSSSAGANGRRITVIPNIILTLAATDTIELYVELVDSNGANAKLIAGETSITGFKLI
jgi:hypothetical protein